MTSMAFTARAFLLRLAVAVAIVFLFAMLSRAGGPDYIAGTSYFDSTTTGQPLVWAEGQITYYTDQGDLSPILPNTSANSFVANAFSQWTAVPTAALAVTWGGQLAEDVTGSNITISDGVITGPADIAMDDVAAISRLYPVTAQNQSNFSGSQVFATSTARVYGSVWFTDPAGNPTQPMQGVNVVARWIDPATGLPSRQYAASSVSGFLFTGNAGNPITGFDDALGTPFSQWGSNSATVEGFFDLAGLELPDGGSGQYQLTVEGLDPTWSVGVGPYAPLQVTPSGSSEPITVTVAAGTDVEQDIQMTGSAQPVPPWAASESWSAPAPVLPAGNWMGSLSGYGDVPYFLLPVQANRSLSVAVMALDPTGLASESKA